MQIRFFIIPVLFLFISCAGTSPHAFGSDRIRGTAGTILLRESYISFNEPWAMTFLPDGRLLVTEKSGTLLLVGADHLTKVPVSGVPEVAYGGQGGLGDVVLHPDYAENKLVYISYAEQGPDDTKGAAVARARLDPDATSPSLHDLEVIWRQEPKVTGSGHYAHRLAFSPDGKLFITSGERQKQQPAQDWSQNLGKIIRLNADGSVPPDNPFQDRGKLARSFWTLGHRNMLGIAFEGSGRLWINEMGPRHGDELNRIVAGDNYGWPLVSWGDQYSGLAIPDHDTRPEFHAPEAYWIPTIAPSGLIIYSGSMFAMWQGNAIMGGLASQSIIRVKIADDVVEEVERFAMKKRIREVEQGPDGAIWILEDKHGGRLQRLTPFSDG